MEIGKTHKTVVIHHGPPEVWLYPEPSATDLARVQRVSLLTKAQRATREIRHWIVAGMPIAPKEVRLARLAFCERCAFYAADGNWGLGECRAPGCGCSRVKAAFANSRCPHPDGPRWDAVDIPPS